jgi:hypothetical protein
MPDPQPMPVQPQKELPSNLDELVRKALSGGSVEAVRRALVSGEPGVVKQEEKQPYAPLPMRSVIQAPVIQAPVIQAPVIQAPVIQASVIQAPVIQASVIQAPVIQVLPLGWQQTLEESARRLQQLSAQEETAAKEGLIELIFRLQQLVTEKPVPVVSAPPIRFAWMLVIQAKGSAETLSAVLGVDLATARAQLLAGYPKIVLRSNHVSELEPVIQRAMEADLSAEILSREEFLKVARPWCVLGLDQGQLQVHGEAGWELSVPLGVPEKTVPLLPVWLVVVGEVVSQRQRGAREPGKLERGRVGAAGALQEQRVMVLDLYGEGERAVRIVEGVTNMAGFPGYEVGSSRLSFKRLVEWLEGQGADVVPKRVVAAVGEQRGSDGSRVESGWPAWEEHSWAVKMLRSREGQVQG